jgi:iron complex outermembrane receptor protein
MRGAVTGPAWRAALAGAAAMLLGAPMSTAASRDLAELSIEELMQESVTSVSKKESSIGASAAAISVLPAAEIERFGATTVPEALRLVPGMNVARISGNDWAVSARGFNAEFATKLLVLVDGRTVYTPASAGVFWNSQDLVLADLQRIEVIRGPGATMWGSNAVNGVVNVTSKNAAETQGSVVTASFGAHDERSGFVRHGGALGGGTHYRVFVHAFDRPGLRDVTGGNSPADWQMVHAGFRVDGPADRDATFTFQGDYYDGQAARAVTHWTLAPPRTAVADSVENNRGGNVLGRWTRTFSPNSRFSAQAYVDRVVQGDGYTTEKRDTVDVELQHRGRWRQHDLVWGAGYRHMTIDLSSSPELSWNPDRHDVTLTNAFVQDEIGFRDDHVRLTLGTKIEKNSQTRAAHEPNARLLWAPTTHQSAWVAISRAVRTPSLFERSGSLNSAVVPTGGLPLLVRLQSNPALLDEKLIAHEAGYRIEPAKGLSFDFAAFYNRYRDLTRPVADPVVVVPGPAPLHLLASSTFQNTGTGSTYGWELSTQWQVSHRWKLAGSYTGLRMDMGLIRSLETESPRHQFQVRSTTALGRDWEAVAACYYTSRVSSQSDASHWSVPANLRCDIGVAWTPASAWDVRVGVQNLLERRHAEFGGFGALPLIEIPRTASLRITWRY